MKPHLFLVIALAACNGKDDERCKDGGCDTDLPREVITPRADVAWLAAGGNHTCALTGGSLACFGRNGLGESDPPAGTTYTFVTSSSQFNCALDDAGKATCWGTSGEGRLDAPQDVVFVDVDAGPGHACGIVDDGSLRCWGRDALSAHRPPPGTWIDVDVGNDTSCALDTSGLPICWGSLDALESDAPTGVYDRIELGTSEACALTPDGDLSCWGGAAIAFDAPTNETFASVSLGDSAACGIRADDGSVLCWGGAGPGFGSEVVSGVPAGLVATQVVVGTGHACAIDAAGALTCWGDDAYGAATAPSAASFVGVAAVTSAACGILADDTLDCLGDHPAFATIDGEKYLDVELHGTDACVVSDSNVATCGLGSAKSVALPGTEWVQAVDYGNKGFCGRTDAGSVSCFNRAGAVLGEALPDTYSALATGTDGICGLTTAGALGCIGAPEGLDLPDGTYAGIAMGGFGCLLDAAGAVTCWGSQLPTGEPPSTDGFAQLAVAGTFACALDGDGAATCWGDNVPEVPALAYASLDAESGSMCGVTVDDGTLVCWGELVRQPIGTVGP